MAEKKKREAETPLHTTRRGQIFAIIEERVSNSGYSYMQFEITRKWLVKSSQSEKSGVGLFEHQENEIVDVVRAACQWIREQSKGTEVVAETHDQEVRNGSDTFGVSMQTEDSPEA